MNKKGVKVVVIGGGSGVSVVLRGLKQFTDQITAIVTVADDGGSSGKLREDLGMLPPGDIRNCIVALSNAEPIMQQLMQYRFKEGQFSGHSLGNMLIAGIADMQGGFEEALACVHNIFAVTGKVLPVSLEDITLYAQLNDGNTVRGESNIPNVTKWNNTQIARVYIEPAEAKALNASVNAILEADIVLIGPGSLYTSIIPNLLINDIKDALGKTKAKKVLSMNLMTQPGETDQMSFLDHVTALIDHVGVNIFDIILVNDKQISTAAKQKYAKENAQIIMFCEKQRTALKALGIEVIKGDYVEEYAGYVRHDAIKFSQTLVNLVKTKRYKGI